ncbi:MAG: class I SAM-dependent methyltransferase, partial [Alphaproteobacteria bacterium]|nr:class I SAM-dependent methyltransferase [Alphaproteobacteria bacterium]
FAQYIPLLGTVEDQIVDCFKAGGGVPYAAYTRFHEVMAEDSGQTVLPALIDHILPLVPGLTEKLNDGIDVLDVGCGSGRALNLMARHFPASRFQGFDLSEEATGYATAEARAQGSDNVRFDARDVTRLESGEQYDLICAFDAIHDQADPAAVLAGIQRTLKPGGTFLMQDISASSHVQNNMDHPIAPLLYTMSCMHCMTVSLAQDGAGLGAMWGRELALKMLAEAGFGDVKVEHLDHDFQNAYYVAAKG